MPYVVAISLEAVGWVVAVLALLALGARGMSGMAGARHAADADARARRRADRQFRRPPDEGGLL
jgi:hypothetical protein